MWIGVQVCNIRFRLLYIHLFVWELLYLHPGPWNWLELFCRTAVTSYCITRQNLFMLDSSRCHSFHEKQLFLCEEQKKLVTNTCCHTFHCHWCINKKTWTFPCKQWDRISTEFSAECSNRSQNQTTQARMISRTFHTYLYFYLQRVTTSELKFCNSSHQFLCWSTRTSG